MRRGGKLPPRSSSIRLRWAVLSIAITIAALIIAATRVDTSSLRATLSTIPLWSLTVATVFLLTGAALAACRFWIIASDVGQKISARDAVIALAVGQIAGALTVQFFGQILARSAVLAPKGVSAPANIAITLYERLTAVAVSCGMAVIGSWFLFGRLAVDLQAGGDRLIRIAVGVLAAILGGSILGWGKLALHVIRPRLTRKAMMSIARNFALTVAIQLCTGAAYVTIVSGLAPALPLHDIAAASAVVMFAASLPISFAGWGVRELSAVLALSLIGMNSGSAFAAAVLVGGIALFALIFMSVIGSLLPAAKTGSTPRDKSVSGIIDLSGFVKWSLSLVAVTGVFFQIFVPFGGTPINVNLADPVVILGGAVFVLYYLIWSRTVWRVHHLEWFVIAATCVILFSSLIGYQRYGWIDWALTNKLTGWFILIAYGMTGALVVRYAGSQGYAIFLRTFTGVGIALAMLDLLMLAITRVGYSLPPTMFAVQLEGFSQNRNAFSFLLLLCLCCAAAVRGRGVIVAISVFSSALWFAGSRAALVTLIILTALFLVKKIFSLRALVAGYAIGICISVVLTSLSATEWFDALSSAVASSDLERWASLLAGVQLFFAHPVFGAGLGAYIAEQAGAARIVVIHSTPIWILAEMGLVGAAAFLLPAMLIFRNECGRNNLEAKVLISVLVTFALMSSVHELLYQRALWLVLGASLIGPGQSRSRQVLA